MSLLIPLVKAGIKGFLRNKKAITLLLILPLTLISIVFLSFNPDGLRKINVGIILDTSDFEISRFEELTSYFLQITRFNTVQECLSEVKEYRQYACIEVLKLNSFVLNVYYDNTQEPVIWEIIERIEKSANLMEQEKSKEMASDFLNDFKDTMGKVNVFKKNLLRTTAEIDTYISSIRTAKEELLDAKKDLSESISQMDRDIDQIKSTRNIFEQSRKQSLESINSEIRSLETVTSSDLSSLKSLINYYNSIIDSYLSELDKKIASYERNSQKGKEYLSKIDSKIETLDKIRKDLESYKEKLRNLENEITVVQNKFRFFENIEPENLVEPLVVKNFPIYIPELESEIGKQTTAKSVLKGLNLISLQTLFPNILFLITLFLSLLVSSFVCLSEINSSITQRIRLIKGSFFPEFLSTYISSMCIMAIPFAGVLLLGNVLFKIRIIQNIFLIFPIFFLLSSIFVFIGIGLAYFIRKESITLLITTFVLVFFIFFTGLMLPVERMSKVPFLISKFLPGKVALSTFSRVAFYNQGFYQIKVEIFILLLWFFSAAVVALLIKSARADID